MSATQALGAEPSRRHAVSRLSLGRAEVRRPQRLDGRELGHHRALDSRAARRRRAARGRPLGARRRVERADRAARHGRRRRRHGRAHRQDPRAARHARGRARHRPDAVRRRGSATLEQLVAGVKLVGEVSPRVHARVLATGELAATELGAAYLRSTGLDVEWLRHPRVPRKHDAARPDRARALLVGALRFLGRPARCRSASRAIRRHRAVAGLHRAQRPGRDGAARPRRLRHVGRLPRGQARSAPARDLDRRAGLLQCRPEGRALGAAHQEPALPRGTGDRVGGRRHPAPAQHLAGARLGHPAVLEVHRPSRVGGQRDLQRARRRRAAAQGDLAAQRHHAGIDGIDGDVAPGRLSRRRVQRVPRARPVRRPDLDLGEQRHRVGRRRRTT